MPSNTRHHQFLLLLGVLALSGLTTYAYRASEPWRDQSAAPGKLPTTILSHPRGRNAASPVITLTSAAAITHSEVLLTAEGAAPAAALAPVQSGGNYNIIQVVVQWGEPSRRSTRSTPINPLG